jgi:UDP-N-acetylglucosamine 2-epimerase (non-hydrolysing)
LYCSLTLLREILSEPSSRSILAGIDEKSLVQAVATAVDINENGDYGIPVPDYIEENVSTKVVKIIQSYTGVVDRMVWRKY